MSSFFDLVYLAGCAAEEKIPDAERIAGMDLDAVYREADRHMLGALAAMTLESAGILDERSSRRIAAALRKAALFDKERKAVLTALENAGIWYLPLKGAVIRDLYPKFVMREMSDHDILFDASRADDVKTIMTGLGFTAHEFGSGVHDAYFKKPVLNFEMHRKLFGNGYSRVICAYYQDVKERLVKDPENAFGWHFTPEDLYVYLLAHAHKHFSGGGTGLRSLLDFYLILKKIPLDMAVVAPELEKLELSDFEHQVRTLSQDLFSGQKLTEEELETLYYVENSGTYGTTVHLVGNKIQKAGGGKRGKWKYIFNRLFPSMDQIEEGNNFFYRHKLLLPFLLPYRLLRAVFRRKARFNAELKALKKF